MPKPLVLLYHGFGPRSPAEDPQNLFVREEAFESQLRTLLRRGHRPLDEAAFLEGLRTGRWPARSFFVTIDDGYVSTLEVAAPILGRLDIPAVLFALPGLLGATSRWMPEMPAEPLLDGDGLRELDRMGISIGLHGLDHSSLAGRTESELQQQTVQARQLITEVVGREPALFAYPFGYHDEPARRAVADAGFAAAFAIYDACGGHAFPRVDVNATDTARTFRLKTSAIYPLAKGALDRVPAVRRTAHTLLGRAAR